MTSRPVVLAYRNHLLPISETFVFNQTVRLTQHQAFFLGARFPAGLRIELPAEHLRLINEGGVAGWSREAAFKLLGHAPRDVLTWARNIGARLIHAHSGADGAIVMPMASRLALPLIVSFQGSDATMKDEYIRHSYRTHRLYLRRRRRLNQNVARVVVPSEFLRDKVIRQHGFAERKVRLIPHGVDLDEFQPSEVPSLAQNILYVGRIIELKGLHLLIKALESVRTRFPEARLTVVGDGPRRATCEALAAAVLGGNFAFLGAQPHTSVKEQMQLAQVFSVPSVRMPSGEAESMGLVFLEAMAMKVPVVSFRSGGVPEVVVDGETGLLAREGDVNELARHLMTLLEDSSLRERMGAAGRAWVERTFKLRTQNDKLEALYDEVLEQAARAEVHARE